MSSSSRNSGFTLLEVLIAIVLLIVISLAIYQATTETFRLRDRLSHEGEFYNSIRMAMSILERDVALIYSPTIMVPESDSPPGPTDARDLEAILSGDIGRTTEFWNGAIDKSGIRPSHFIGTETKLSFVATSHIRVHKEAPESEFNKIVYDLQGLRTLDDNPEGNSLVKTYTPNAFDDENEISAKDRRRYALLHGVTKLRFRYYRKDKEQWSTSWDSDKDDLKNKYPDIIEVSLEVKGPSRLVFEGTYKFRPEIPLNGLDPST